MATKWRSHIRWRDRVTWRGVGAIGALTPNPRYVVRQRARSYRVQWLASEDPSMSRKIWPAKDPGETLNATFDFAAGLPAGVTLDSATVTVSLAGGADVAVAGVLVGAPVIDGGTVLQRLAAGASGATYTLRCVATLSTGSVLVLAATLPVRTA